jgi:hypothetical protein
LDILAAPDKVVVSLGVVSREYPRSVIVEEVGGAAAAGLDEVDEDFVFGGLRLLEEGLLEEDLVEEEGLEELPLFLLLIPPNRASRLASFSRLCLGPALVLLGGAKRASRLASLFCLYCWLMTVVGCNDGDESAAACCCCCCCCFACSADLINNHGRATTCCWKSGDRKMGCKFPFDNSNS